MEGKNKQNHTASPGYKKPYSLDYLAKPNLEIPYIRQQTGDKKTEGAIPGVKEDNSPFAQHWNTSGEAMIGCPE